MIKDFEHCYRAVKSRDARFDGWFFTAVSTTGIYCRPSCPAMTPKPGNASFYPTAAAAQRAGFRACKRCRPDAVPGSPEWDARADLAGRAMRLIADGVVDREGVAGLARRLAYTERHLHRMLVAEVGAGPIALARARRAHTARLLIETTDLPITEVAFAAGFSSVRQFNDTFREVFASAPRELRRSRQQTRRGSGRSAPGEISLRLPFRSPFDLNGLLRFLGDRAVEGVEALSGGAYRRTLRLPHGAGVAALSDGGDHVRCVLGLEDLRDLGSAVQRCRRLLDLATRTRSRWTTSSGMIRSSDHSCGVHLGGEYPAAWTARNLPSGRCSASRSPWSAPAPSPDTWSPGTDSLSASRSLRPRRV